MCGWQRKLYVSVPEAWNYVADCSGCWHTAFFWDTYSFTHETFPVGGVGPPIPNQSFAHDSFPLKKGVTISTVCCLARCGRGCSNGTQLSVMMHRKLEVGFSCFSRCIMELENLLFVVTQDENNYNKNNSHSIRQTHMVRYDFNHYL